MKSREAMLVRISAVYAGIVFVGGVATGQGLTSVQNMNKNRGLITGQELRITFALDEPGHRGAEFVFKDLGLGAVFFGQTEVTRIQWRAYLESGGEDVEMPPFSQSDDEPVVGITFEAAKAFCAWITLKGRTSGSLTAAQTCRLPTNAEWGAAAGLRYTFEGAPPHERQLESGRRFGWGMNWPPPGGRANLAEIFEGGDGWEHTSPVGSFSGIGSINGNAIADMIGNVWEWTDDGSVDEGGTLRGGSFTSFRRDEMLLAYEYRVPAGFTATSFGFRPVIEDLGLARGSRQSAVARAIMERQKVRDQFLPPDLDDEEGRSSPIIFPEAPDMVALEGRDFFIGKMEVSVREFSEYITSKKIEWAGRPRFRQSGYEAAVGVSKADAEGYCRWLTDRFAETGWEYRLPNGEEWLLAAKSIEAGKFIWGDTWPPPPNSGNFEATKISNYYDGVSYTAPVDKFVATASGCFGFAGNAAEWISDRIGNDAIARGGSWADWEPEKLALDYQRRIPGGKASGITGFRPVLAPVLGKEVAQ